MSALTAAPVIEVTSGAGRTHLVAEDQFIIGRRSGRFVARCGAPVLAASMTTREREWCSRCRHEVGAHGND